MSMKTKDQLSTGAGRSWNVIENKGSCVLKAGMLLKRKEVGGSWQVGGGAGVRVRSQNEEHLLSAGCLLLTAYCLLRS